MKNLSRYFLAAALTGLVVTNATAAITAYVSKFDQEAIEEAYTTGTVFYTDNFNAAPPVGTFTSFSTTRIAYTSTGLPRIIANDQYGGDGEGNYLGVTDGATLTATFDVPVSYFGLYISALDGNNVVKLYNGTTLLLTFNASTLKALLPNNPTSTVRAIDGSVYNTNQYYGKPNTTLNAAEPYAYVSFFATGTLITSAVLSETTAIFETDNYSLRTPATAVAGSLVLIPEPATFPVVIASGGLLCWMLASRRRKNA